MILVVGATSPVGRTVVEELHLAGEPVRALSRRPEQAALPPQVDVVAGDLDRPATLEAAAAPEAGVRRVVLWSSGAVRAEVVAADAISWVVTGTVERVTGRPARTHEAWGRDHLHLFR